MNERKRNKVWLLSLLTVLFLAVLIPMTTIRTEAASPKISKKSIGLIVGEKYTLKVSGVSKSKVTWKSSKTSVATVTKNGKVTAKKRGTAKISAKIKGGKTLKCTVKVAEKPTVVATLAETGTRPDVTVGLSISLIGSKSAKLTKSMTLKTPSKKTQTLYLWDLEKTIEKGDIVWKKSLTVKPFDLDNPSVSVGFYSRKDGEAFYVSNKSKATITFTYDGVKMKAVVPNSVRVKMVNGQPTTTGEAKQCKVSSVN